MKQRATIPFADRLWAKIDRSSGPDGCWPWMGAVSRRYGYLSEGPRTKSKLVRAHRAIWELEYGAIPPNTCICHHCDTPLCCNPSHLFLGTHQENMDDMRRKGREARGELQGCAKLNEAQVFSIRDKVDLGERQVDIAKEYGVSCSAIYKIASRKNWSHV